MGACASCLGLNRHPSQDGDHLDRLLDSEQPSYGAIDDSDLTQPDEDEMRREREALDHITAQAADNMIDVLHPSQNDWDQHDSNMNSYDASHQRDIQNDRQGDAGEEQDPEEAAWFESIQSAGLVQVQVPQQRGGLVMDMGVLREGPQHQKTARAEPAY